MAIELDPETEVRLRSLAKARQRSPEMILREAIEQYLDGNVNWEQAEAKRHPSGRPWPHRNPVGGIITPV